MNQTLNYELFDNTPVIGNNYYRLKIIDLDETFEYSNIVIIKLNAVSADGIAGVFPNPSSGTFTLLLSSVDNQQSTLKVYDVLGRILINRSIEVVAGTNTVDVNLHDFANATSIYLNTQTVVEIHLNINLLNSNKLNQHSGKPYIGFPEF